MIRRAETPSRASNQGDRFGLQTPRQTVDLEGRGGCCSGPRVAGRGRFTTSSTECAACPIRPHRIARGIFAGVFTTFTPFFGLHFVVAAILARLMRGNILAALLATFFGNPLTYVPIGVVSLKTGHFLLGLAAAALMRCTARSAASSSMPGAICGTISWRCSRPRCRLGCPVGLLRRSVLSLPDRRDHSGHHLRPGDAII